MIEVKQAWEAGNFQFNEQDDDDSSYSVYYIVSGCSDETAALDAVVSQAPESLRGAPRQSINISERLTDDDWKVEVTYAESKSGSGSGGGETGTTNESTYNFEITTANKKMVFPVKHRRTYPSKADAPTCGINDGEGVDVIMPVGHFSETHYMSPTRCTNSYRRTLTGLVGKINRGTFRGFGEGEVLFLGATGSRTGNEMYQITYNFAVGQDETGIEIGDITGIRKGAWDIIWCQYTEQENSARDEVVRKVKAVHVEQVYRYDDFGKLGIGN